MPVPNLSLYLLGENAKKLSSSEKIILEAELLSRIYQELKAYFQPYQGSEFLFLNSNIHMEYPMLETNFLKYVIKDILISEDYSISGIACYTQTTEDAICDIITGRNNYPSLFLSQKLIDLHRSARPQLYDRIIKKITNELLSLDENEEI